MGAKRNRQRRKEYRRRRAGKPGARSGPSVFGRRVRAFRREFGISGYKLALICKKHGYLRANATNFYRWENRRVEPHRDHRQKCERAMRLIRRKIKRAMATPGYKPHGDRLRMIVERQRQRRAQLAILPLFDPSPEKIEAWRNAGAIIMKPPFR